MSNLIRHAELEMRKAGLYDKDSDYGGMIPEAVMALVEAHSEQGHSGGSHAITLAIFNKVINFEPLTDLTNDPDEWHLVTDDNGEGPLYQNKRKPSTFCTDINDRSTWRDNDEGYCYE